MSLDGTYENGVQCYLTDSAAHFVTLREMCDLSSKAVWGLDAAGLAACARVFEESHGCSVYGPSAPLSWCDGMGC